MFKKVHLPLLGVVVFLSLLLTGCGCKHEWRDATCDTPKTCAKCNETEGEALGHKMVDATCETALICDRCKDVYGNAWGHKFADATCEAPETCIRCPQTQGEALGHTWVDATCTVARVCSTCDKKEGDALGHDWMEATTDAPKTCRRCERTEGDRLIDPRFNAEACQELIGIWDGIVVLKDEETGIEGFSGRLELSYTLVFRADGSYREVIGIANKPVFLDALARLYRDALYAEFKKQGLDSREANSAMYAAYGMTVLEYAEKMAESSDWNKVYGSTFDGVYYVVGNLIYTGERWSTVTESDSFSIKDNTLTIQGLKNSLPNLTITRVS